MTTVCAANEYRDMAKKCDEVAEAEQQVATYNIQIVQIVDKQKDCYKNRYSYNYLYCGTITRY